jgi:uncharacterized protein
MFLVTVQSGQEVLETIAAHASDRGVTDAAIVSLIGAVDTACVSTMSQLDATDNTLIDYDQPMEATGTGEIRDGTVHIHIVLGVEGNTPISGHLHRATVETHFVNAYIQPLTKEEQQ